MEEERERNQRKDMDRRNEGKERGRTTLPGHYLPMTASFLPALSGALVLSTEAGKTSWILRIEGLDIQGNTLFCT